ncbi:MAG: hypothetical protein GKR91_09135 [Pseudomonadales bacterium]|nr:hypothetical protein [Pseudomonadales bacterium]
MTSKLLAGISCLSPSLVSMTVYSSLIAFYGLREFGVLSMSIEVPCSYVYRLDHRAGGVIAIYYFDFRYFEIN